MYSAFSFHKLFHLFRIYARAMQVVWQADPRYTCFTFFTSVFSALTIPAQAWIAKLVIDQVSFAAVQPDGLTASSWQTILLPIGLYLLIWAVSESFQAVAQSVEEVFCIKMDQHARWLILRKAAGLSTAFYESAAYFDRMDIAANQVWRFSNVAYFFFHLLTEGSVMVSLFLLLGQVSLLIPLLLLLTALPRVIVQSIFNNRKALMLVRNTGTQRLAEYLGELLTGRDTVKEIRLFQLQNVLLNGFLKHRQKFLSEITRLTLSQERANLLLSVLSTGGTGAAWLYTFWLAILARISLGDIALIFQSTERMRAALNQTFYQVGWMLENSLFLEHFFAFLDMEANAMPGALVYPSGANHKTLSVSTPQPIAWGAIEFRQVSFRYPGSEQIALGNISMILRPGETVALVGENGAGKTTLIKLLARLYDPTEGQILLNGVDLREYTPEDYYRQLGVIFQDFVRYDLSVQENIGFGQAEHLDNRARLRQAAQLGGALGLIEKLPQEFSTVLGKRFEEGTDLSGGEWQKIALSRAFMRDANLLILDEPTAALDVYAESDVYNRFAELTRGKTTVFVTHRLSSVKMAQKILVLKGGHLIETGAHAELLAKGGEYARMFTLQAERYQ